MISLTCSLAGMTVTVTKIGYVEMLQKIIPEDSPNISSEPRIHAEWSTGTHIKDGYGEVEGSLSRENDLAEISLIFSRLHSA